MAETPDSGKHPPVEHDYFVRRFGVDIELTPVQQEVYFLLPEYHRMLIEFTINDKFRDPFWRDAQMSVELLSGAIRALSDELNKTPYHDQGERWQGMRGEATVKWGDYQSKIGRIEPCMNIHVIGAILFPLVNLSGMGKLFVDGVSELVTNQIIREHKTRYPVSKVCLAEIEKIADDYLSPFNKFCLKVWRGYLNDKTSASFQSTEKSESQRIKTEQSEYLAKMRGLAVPLNVDTSEKNIIATSGVSAKKPDTKQQYQYWNDEIIRLWKTGKYRNKTEICRRIEVDEGGNVSAKHINDVTPIKTKDLKNI